MKRILILGYSRSGTSTLVNGLKALGYNIAFEPFRRRKDLNLKNRKVLRSFIEELMEDRNAIKHNSGLELYLEPMLYRKFADHIIFIYRKNSLKRDMSRRIAQGTKIYSVNDDPDAKRKAIKEFDYKKTNLFRIALSILAHKLHIWGRKILLKLSGKPYVILPFEDFYSQYTPEQKLSFFEPFIPDNCPKEKITELKNLLNPIKSKVNTRETYKLLPHYQSAKRWLSPLFGKLD